MSGTASVAAQGLKTSYIQLAKQLPPKLQRFLARYPPATIRGQATTRTGYQTDTRNPFLPSFFKATGRWHKPVFSARRTADLVKLARDHGVEELMPYTPKKTTERLTKRVALGWRGKGTGVGQKVKGRKNERMLEAKYVHLMAVLLLLLLLESAEGPSPLGNVLITG